RENKAAGPGSRLIAELRAVGVTVVVLVRLEQRVEEVSERRAAARAAAVLHQPIGAERPAGHGLDREAQTGQARPAAGETVFEANRVRVLHLGKKHFVLKAKARE